jgi:hypothetical protein
MTAGQFRTRVFKTLQCRHQLIWPLRASHPQLYEISMLICLGHLLIDAWPLSAAFGATCALGSVRQVQQFGLARKTPAKGERYGIRRRLIAWATA